MPHKNLAVELLRKLLNDEIKVALAQEPGAIRSFAEMLERAIRAYQNRAIETVQVIEELIELAKQMREANRRGEALGLTEDEIAFYDALEVNDSAVAVLGDETLKTIARELVEAVRRNVTIDWTVKASVRAEDARHGQAHPAPARLPAGQAGEGHPDRCWSRRNCCAGIGPSDPLQPNRELDGQSMVAKGGTYVDCILYPTGRHTHPGGRAAAVESRQTDPVRG